MTADVRSGPVFRQPGTVLTDHMFTVPLDHQRPGGEQIEVFAREVAPAGRRDSDPGLPWLVYLQGGPGFGSPRPFGRESWLSRALDDYRVLLLDQRGTGRSTPASRHTLARLASPRAQADYLSLLPGRLDRRGTRNSSGGGWPAASRGACWARASAASAR